jgi:hypothetical protein
MEWTDKLKRELDSRGRFPGVWFLVALLVLVILILFADVGVTREVHADDSLGSVHYRDRLIEAEEDQAKYLRRIADELHQIRLEMKKR